MISWGYWTCEGYQYLFPETDCSEPPPPPPPKPEPPPPPPPKPEPKPEPEPEPKPMLPPKTQPHTETTTEPSPTIAPETISTPKTKREPPAPTTVDPYGIISEETPPEPKCDEDNPPTHHFSLDSGWNLFHFPLGFDGGTLSSLHNTLADIIGEVHRLQHFNKRRQQWVDFNPEGYRIFIDRHTGVRIYHKGDAASYTLQGCLSKNNDKLILTSGWNAVGFPQVYHGLSVIDDFFEHPLIAEVQYEVEGETFTVSYDGSKVKTPIELWKSYMVKIIADHTIDLSYPEFAPQAPQAHRTLATSWGRIKSRYDFKKRRDTHQ